MTDNLLITSLIGLSGVIIGSTISSIVNLRVKSKETKLRIIEKIFDKRIQAYENILFLIKTIRAVISTEKADKQNHVIAFPSSMTSKENFANYKHEVFTIIHQNIHWLNTDLEREFWFLQDYLGNLNNRIKDAKDSDLPRIGVIVKQDFIDLAYSLENLTFNFFRKDIYDVKINKNNEWHKYPKEKTLERLYGTELYTNEQEIYKIIHNK